MRVKIYTQIEPLTIGSGEDAFTIQLRELTDADRLAALRAVAADVDFAQLGRVTNTLICGWSNVRDEHGNVIPFETKDASGNRVCNLDRVMASLPMAVRGEVMCAILAVCGVPRETVDALLKGFGSLAASDPITPPSLDTATACSASSSPIATSPS